MSYLLTDPTVVLAVGGSEADLDRLRSVVVDGDATDVVAAGSVPAALETLAERDDIGCAVVLGPATGDGGQNRSSDTDGGQDRSSDNDGDGSGDGDDASVRPAAVCRRIGDAEPLVPVVVHAPASACDHAAVAGLRDCQYLPVSADDKRIRAVIDDALATFEERRRRDAESSLFTTLLEEGELPLFAKDDRGRHVYKADVEDDVDPESVVGRTDIEITPDPLCEQAEKDYQDDLDVVETGEPIYGQVREYVHPDHEHWSRTTKVPWEDEDGEVQGLVGFAKDVTQQKIYERRLEEQAERVDQFISYVSHDLRTPLQIAYGSIEQARRGDEAALDKVEEAVGRIEDIVDDLRQLSKSDSGPGVSSSALQQFRADSMTTDLVPLVDEVWSVIAPDEADLTVELPADAVVATEAKALRPAVENLLKNAVDHAGPDVTVWVGEAGDDGFFVADDGPGIPPGERPKVTQAGYTTTEDGSGTGLDIVAETVDQHGWHLTVTESRAGGARFEITGLPMVTERPTDIRPGERVALDANCDVGPVGIQGSAEFDADADQWTVVADGRNVWSDIHEFHCVYGEATPPVRIEGRIDDLDGVEEYSKAGFAVRAGLDERDPFGYVGTTEAHGSEVTWRGSEDGFTDSDQFEELPGTFPWYRVEYVDGHVTCYLSEDCEEWRPVDQRRLDLGETVTVALMACSHSSNQTCEVTFSEVRAYELDGERR